jgi:hypothetical protein
LWTLSTSSLKAFWSISCVSVAIFPRWKQNLKQIHCSVRSDITISQEELGNTWENWQHKPVQTFTVTSTWLLTREGCNYIHLVGKHSATIRKSSPKPVRFFFGPPTYNWIPWRKEIREIKRITDSCHQVGGGTESSNTWMFCDRWYKYCN